MRIPALLTILLFAAAPACQAQAPAAQKTQAAWRPLFEAPDGSISIFADTARVERDPQGFTRMWLRFVYATPETLPAEGNEPARTFSRVEVHQRLDCGGARVADLRTIIRDDAERQVGDFSDPPRWRAFAEHPFGAEVFVLACALPK